MSLYQLLKALSPVRRWAHRAVLAALFLLLACGNFTVARMWYFQARSAAYPVVEGVVLEHKKAPPEDAKPLVVEYAYEVNGQRFTSNKYWYEAFGSTVTDDAAAARFPVGARVSVSYDPDDPADAVLIPGLQGADVLALWGLAALHLVVFFFAFIGPVAGGTDYSADRRIVPTPFGWRLVPTVERVWPGFCLALTGTILLGLCVTPGWASSFPPLWEAIGLTAAVVAGAVVATAAWGWLLREKSSLEVDTEKRELRWNSGGPFADTFALAFEVVEDVRCIELEYSPGRFVYWPQIVWITPEQRTRILELPACLDCEAVEVATALIRDAVLDTDPAPAAS